MIHRHASRLKPDEAAAVLGMSPKTLANWRVSGYGPPWARFGGSVRYDSVRLYQWMESQESRPRNASTQPERETRMAVQGRRPRIQPHHRLGRHATKSDCGTASGGGCPPVGIERTGFGAPNPDRTF